MKKKTLFEIWCFILLIVIIFLLANQWYKFIPIIYLDSYIFILLILAIGISLLPFVEKIKIGNFLELERIKEEIVEIKLTQYLGEVIKNGNSIGDIYYYDADGKHILPDPETATFLRTSKGEVNVTPEILDKMKSSYKIDSVKTSRKVKWGGHQFVILNDKKYHVSSMGYFNDWGMTDSDITEIPSLSSDQLKLFPTGK
ncbi:MAG: hypothetical protein JNL53_19815 [Cyclobacteriaceae bacterium]|nr:hypothetical protein [Cyclobacteriaceae bacterium]